MKRKILASLVSVVLSCSSLDKTCYVASESMREYGNINARLNMRSLSDEQRWGYDRLAFRLFKEGNTFEALDLYRRLGGIEGIRGIEMMYNKALKEGLENASDYKEILDLMRKKNFGKNGFVYGSVVPKYGPVVPKYGPVVTDRLRMRVDTQSSTQQ